MDERTELRQLLYRAIRELEFIQNVENCGTDMCATPVGREIIEEGCKLLGTNDFENETLSS